jgi:hypothetical protein
MKKVFLVVALLFNAFLAQCSCGQKEDSIIMLPPINPPVPCKIDKDCIKESFGSCFTGICIKEECHYGYFIDGTPCDDKNPCTEFGECFKGKCIQGKFMECPLPENDCIKKGYCDSLTGECIYEKKPNNTPCNNQEPCTSRSYCLNGECISVTFKDCVSDNPCIKGSCNKTTGHCEYTNVQNGTNCSDDLWCNGIEICKDGVCSCGKEPCENLLCDEVNKKCIECLSDHDCKDGIWCNGAEWCCYAWRVEERGCVENFCYPGISPCGIPMWEMDTVCDCDWDSPCQDICRSCKTDEECDNHGWCDGKEYCINGICQHDFTTIPCIDIMLCNEEKHFCAPECLTDRQCSSEQFCDSNGKCQNL